MWNSRHSNRTRVDFDGAITALDEALKLEPRDARLRLLRARAWKAKGDADKATADLQAVLALPARTDAERAIRVDRPT